MQTANESQTWASICHLSCLAGVIIPFGNFLGPLFIWLWKRGLSPLVDDQGKEALNFQISLFAYFWAILILLGGPALLFAVLGGVTAGKAESLSMFVVLAIAFGLLMLLFFFTLAGVGLVFPIIAAVKANAGQAFRYPLTFRLVK